MSVSSNSVSPLGKKVPMVVEDRKQQENSSKKLQKQIEVALDHFNKLVKLDLTEPKALYRWNFKRLTENDRNTAKCNMRLIKDLDSKLEKLKSQKERLQTINGVGKILVEVKIKMTRKFNRETFEYTLPPDVYWNLVTICPEWCPFD